MPDPVGKISGSNPINTIDTSDENVANKMPGNIAPGRAPSPADVNTTISFKGGTISNHAKIPKAYSDAIDQIRQPKPSNTFFAKLGRAVLWIVNLFKGVKSSSSLSTAEKLNALRGKQPAPLPDIVENEGKPYIFRLDQLANLAGLDKSKGLRYEPFYNLDKEPGKPFKDVLFPHGEPRLADIKQNPDLQDCWFLSAISAQLQSQGTESILRLFSESKIEGNVVIRLGANLYDVPMARIADGGGDKFGSDSANWVVALENAMLMHLSLSVENPEVDRPTSLEAYKEQIKMPLQGSQEGLTALQGYQPVSEISAMKKKGIVPKADYEQISWVIRTVEQGEAYVSRLLSLGKPVVIGHNGGTKVALRDGVAPGHAVTVLESVPNGYRILDPYGKVKTISKEAILDYTLCSIRDSHEPEEFYEFEGLNIPKEEVEFTEEMKRELDNSKDDF